MQLRLPVDRAGGYKSLSRRAGLITEAWAEENLYCAACTSPRLTRAAPNTEAIDFTCPKCESPFQLKGQARPIGRRIPDAAYAAIYRAVTERRTPNLLAMHYDPFEWSVRSLFLFPRFVISLSMIEKRKPLSATARRHGWVGCDFALDRLPADAKIPLVLDGSPLPARVVREQYRRLRPLEKLGHEGRGWTMDVLNVVRSLGKVEFSLDEVYAFADDLGRLHPRNRHVDDKIRQQLQRLRDLGLLQFVRPGQYASTFARHGERKPNHRLS